MSDIKSAFLNIRIDESDRDFLRFLWIDNIESEAPSLSVKRFISLLFGLKCSPFILLATVNHHMRKHEIENREFAEKFLLDLYIDDNPTGLNDPRVGFEYYLFVKTVMKKAGFLLRKWLSNNKDLLEKINDYEKLYFQEEIVEPTTINKVLGVIWNIDSNELIFDITEIIQKALEFSTVTKRVVLKVVSSIFDPLGILAPLVIILKILFQEVCMMKVGWDVPLATDVIIKWTKALNLLSSFEPVRINRHYINGNDILDGWKIELHGFSDASKKECAAVVYLRAVFQNQILCTIIAAKTKVTPIDKSSLTVPKLEVFWGVFYANHSLQGFKSHCSVRGYKLTACLILSRLMKSNFASISQVYHISEVFLVPIGLITLKK